LKNYKNLRIKGTNIFSVEDDDNIYYIYRPKKRLLENYLAFTRQNPKNKTSVNCTRLIEQYGDVSEQNISTHKVRKVKEIAKDLYKVKTNHTYYMLII